MSSAPSEAFGFSGPALMRGSSGLTVTPSVVRWAGGVAYGTAAAVAAALAVAAAVATAVAAAEAVAGAADGVTAPPQATKNAVAAALVPRISVSRRNSSRRVISPCE